MNSQSYQRVSRVAAAPAAEEAPVVTSAAASAEASLFEMEEL